MTLANDASLGGTGTLTLSGVIGDGGHGYALSKVGGTGTVILTAANTYSGGTTVWNGTLSAANAAALGTGVATVWRGGTLDVNGVTLANALSLAGSGASGTGALTGTGIAGVSGAVTLASAALLGGTGTLTVSGAIGDGGNRHGLYKVDTGTAVLTAANTYSGGTNIWNGTLSAANAAALGTGVATVLNGGTLDVNGVTLANALSLAGSGVGGTGALTGTGIAGVSGALTLGSTARLGGTGTLTVSGVIGDGGNRYGLIKVGTGTAVLTAANTYSGGTNIRNGTLSAANAAALGTGAATVVSGGTLDVNGVTLANALSLTGGGAGGVGALTGTGTAGVSGAVTLTGYAALGGTGTLTLSGAIGGNGYGVNKVGTGTAVLTAANTYSGTTTVSRGVLNIRNAGALGAADGTAATGTTVVANATLALQGGIAVGNEALSLAGLGVNGGGALRSVSGNNSFAGAIALTTGGRINVDADTLALSGGISGAAGSLRGLMLGGAGDGTVSGAIAGNIGFLIKDGTGTWTLTGQSALSDVLQIDAGALRLEAGGRLSSDNGFIAVQAGSSGNATVTGSGSHWTSKGLYIGNLGTGTLTVADGGLVSSQGGYVSYAAGAGSATVTGMGSRWAVSDTLTVGYSGTGTLAVAAGGTVSVGTNGTGRVTVADQAGSIGTLAIGAAPGDTAVAAGTVQAGEVHFGAGTGTLVFNHTGNPDGSAVTFAPTITGAGSLSQLSGTTILTGANTYSGATTVSGGVLNIRNPTALGAADGTAATGTTVAAGAALVLQGGIAVGNEALSIAGFGVSDGGALRSVSGDNSFAGAITLTDDSRINADTGTLTLSGGISGAAGGAARTLELGGAGNGVVLGPIAGNIGYVLKDGIGTWTLSGQSTQGTFGIVNGGALRLEAGGSLTLNSGRIGFASGSSGSVTVTGAGSRWTANTDLQVGSSGTGTLAVAAGGTVSVGTSGTGTVTVADRAGSTGTLAIGAAPGDTALAAGTVQAGEVRFGAGTGRLVFNHTGNPDGSAVTFAPTITGHGSVSHLAGSTILTGANTYTGTTTVSGGTLSAANATALGTSVATVTAGGTLDVNGVTLANPLTLAGSGAGGVGALTGTGTAGVSGAITLAGNATLGGTGSLTVSGRIGDNGSGFGLTKVGTGTALLTGANTYGGGTNVTAGTLALGGGGTLGSPTATSTVAGATASLDLGGTAQTQAAVTLRDGGTLRNGTLAAPITSAGGTLDRIAGTASLTTVAGTTVSSGNSYTGATVVGDGSILRARGAGGFSAASAYTLAGTGTLDLAGASNGIGGLASSSSAAVVTSGAGGPAVLTVAGGGAFAGTIRDGAAPLGLTVAAGGPLVLTGANTYTGATVIRAGATLRLGDGGTSGALAGTAGVANDGTLVLDRSDSVSFAQAIAGSGGLIQAGSGTTILAGRNTYTGATTISGGTLQIDGVLSASEVTVRRGGTLAGSGKIGDPLIEAGGRLAPGSAAAIGTLAIHGPLTFAAGSFYTLKVTPTANDRTAVTGPVTIQGGTVQVLAGAGTYTPALRYTLLTATGGVTGRFTTLQTTSNLAFLTPSLIYDANAVSLGFAQTAPLISAATTANQAGPAIALNGAGPTVTTTVNAAPGAAPAGATTHVSPGGTATTTVTDGTTTTTVVSSPAVQVATAVLNQTAPGAGQALTALSGEIQASDVGAVMHTAALVQETLLDRLRFGGIDRFGSESPLGGRFASGAFLPSAYAALTEEEQAPGRVSPAPARANAAVWGQGLGQFGRTRGDGNAARLTRETGGFLLGLESGYGALTLPGVGDLRVGVAAGYSTSTLDIPARRSSGSVEDVFGAVYGRAALGAVQVRAGAIYGSQALDTSRRVQFPGVTQSATGKAGSQTVQGFGEVGYRIAVGSGFLEPFVGGGALHVGRDGFSEAGGAAALRVFGRGYDVQTATAGVQGEAALSDQLGVDVPVSVPRPARLPAGVRRRCAAGAGGVRRRASVPGGGRADRPGRAGGVGGSGGAGYGCDEPGGDVFGTGRRPRPRPRGQGQPHPALVRPGRGSLRLPAARPGSARPPWRGRARRRRASAWRRDASSACRTATPIETVTGIVPVSPATAKRRSRPARGCARRWSAPREPGLRQDHHDLLAAVAGHDVDGPGVQAGRARRIRAAPRRRLRGRSCR